MVLKGFFHFIRSKGDLHDIHSYPLSSSGSKKDILPIMRYIVFYPGLKARLDLSFSFQGFVQLDRLTMIGLPLPARPNFRNSRNTRGSRPVSRRYQIGASFPKREPSTSIPS